MASVTSLAIVEQFGEFRPIGAAGEEGVDQRGRDQTESVAGSAFLEGLVMSGLLLGEIGVALFEAREEVGGFA